MLKPEKRHIQMSNRSFPKRPKKGKPSTRIPRLGKKLAFFICTRFFASIAFQRKRFSTKRHFSFKVEHGKYEIESFLTKSDMLSKLNPKMCKSKRFEKKKSIFSTLT